MDNINIWFARNKDGSIVTIDKINEDNRYEEYSCPICESKLIPKLGDINAHHLAHKDASKCSRETQIHFFVKNELLKQGDKFTVRLDDESKEFVCKEILIEQEYKTEFGTYKPDITIITEDNKTIYFEVAHTNKKKIEEYLDIWIALNNIVVEIETKEMIEGKTITEFKAKFYEGKCFNIRQEDKDYYELVGRVKLSRNKYPLEQVKKLNYLWIDISKYLLGEVDISDISDLIQAIEDKELREIVVSILRKNRCTDVMKEYIRYNVSKIENEFKDILNEHIKIPRIVYDRIYGNYDYLIKNIKFNYPLQNTINNINNYFYKKEYVDNLLNLLDIKNKISLNSITNIINPTIQVTQPYKYKFTNITNLNYDEIDNIIYHNIDSYNIKKLKENISKKIKRRYGILLAKYITNNILNYKVKVSISDCYYICIYCNNIYITSLSIKNYLNKESLIIELEKEINKKILKELENELIKSIKSETKSRAIKSFDEILIEYDGKVLFKVNEKEYHDKNKIIEKINKLIKSKEINKLKMTNFINYIKNNTNDCNLIINNTSKTIRLDYELEGMLYKDFYKYTIKSTKYCSWRNDKEEILKNINESINNYKILRYIKVILNKRYEKVEGGWYFETYSNDGKTYLELRKRYNKHTYDGYVVQDFEIDLNYKEREKVLENLSSDICNYLRKRKYPWYNK